MDSVMRGSKRVDVSSRNNSHRVERMATQAMRVLDQLALIPGVPKPHTPRPAAVTADIARNKLKSVCDNGINLQNLYSQYDINRSGKVSYKDFSDTLLAVSAGLTREETHHLASTLDSNRVGAIEYTNILEALKQVKINTDSTVSNQQITAPTGTTTTTAPTGTMSTENTYKIAPKTSFSYVGAHNNDAEKISMDETAQQTTVEGNSATSGNSSPNMQHSTTYTPIQTELNARSLVNRRFFHNPTVNTVYYNDTTIPYQFDNTTTSTKCTSSRRRAVSAPGRSRSNIMDSGCNLSIDLNSTINNTNLTEYYDIFRKSPTSTTEVVSVDDMAVIKKLKNNPFYHENANTKRYQDQIQQQERQTVVNSVIDQINGNVSRLKHTLKQSDGSYSGMLNTEEFQSAMKKFGISLSKSQYNDLFISSSNDVKETGLHGYKQNKAIDIEKFTEKLQQHINTTKPNSTTMSTTTNNNTSNTNNNNCNYNKIYGENAQNHEKIRIMKKVLQNSSKLSNPHAVYNSIQPNHNGYINTNQMKESLLYMNTNLSNHEFNVLMNNIPKDYNGNIEIAKFENILRSEVSNYEQNNQQILNKNIVKNKHYSNSYQTSKDFILTPSPPTATTQSYTSNNNEYSVLNNNKGSADENETARRWAQLKDIFQRHPEVIKRTFSTTNTNKEKEINRKSLVSQKQEHEPCSVTVDRGSVSSVSISELKDRMKQAGLPLSSDDMLRLESTLVRKAVEQGSGGSRGEVSLEGFCEAVGLGVRVRDRGVLGTYLYLLFLYVSTIIICIYLICMTFTRAGEHARAHL